MIAVDDVLVRKVGVASSDLPDVLYRDPYDAAYSPEEAADEAIDNAMNCPVLSVRSDNPTSHPTPLVSSAKLAGSARI